jgi:hypothetical protein
MQSYIYHFVGPTKKYLDQCRWQRTSPPELPYPWDKRSRELVAGWGDEPPVSYTLESMVQIETAANLLAAYPNLGIIASESIVHRQTNCEDIGIKDRLGQFEVSCTSYMNLPRLLLRLGPNASRLSVASYTT